MSQLTSNLIGDRTKDRSGKWPPVLALATDRLVSEYGTPTLGNFRDPVKEIFYIVLSARTTERLYKRAHTQLLARFPTIQLIASAKTAEVLECVKVAGLGQKRAGQVIAIASRLAADYGKDPSRRLRRMVASEAYKYLTGLPGVGPKTALCVMMCSLNHDVFPVDINVQRILERLGVLRTGLKHYQAQRIAPRYVPVGRSKDLHIGLVEHGRKVCLPSKPKCESCVLVDLCRHGMKALSKNHRNGVAV